MLVTQPIPNHPMKSILIVDDNDMLLDTLTKAFEFFGLKVFKADNGLDGWALFKSEQIDTVLTDIQMPGLNGIELSHKIRSKSPEIKIALMTGHDAAVAKDLLDDGIADHLFLKPFSLISVCKSLADEVQMTHHS